LFRVTIDIVSAFELLQEFVDADSRILYNLYGIVEHSGSMSRGHYTAFVKQREDNRVLSDMVVSGVKPSSSE